MDAFEPAAVFTAIMAYIWVLRYRYPWFWVAIAGAMLLSHVVRRETPAQLGFRTDNFRECAHRLAAPVALLALLLVSAGYLCGTIRHVSFEFGAASWAIYLPWGVTQQYALNGYFLNRLEKASSGRTAPFLATALFSAAHLPNWFLMAVTLAGGACCTHLYPRYRNLYVLGLAHGTLGVLLYLVVPDSISHHLRVGRY
jgi:hypothetical protein